MNVMLDQLTNVSETREHSLSEVGIRDGVYFARVNLCPENAATDIALPGATTFDQALGCLSILKSAADWSRRPYC
jgi:hypothetical protein